MKKRGQPMGFLGWKGCLPGKPCTTWLAGQRKEDCTEVGVRSVIFRVAEPPDDLPPSCELDFNNNNKYRPFVGCYQEPQPCLRLRAPGRPPMPGVGIGEHKSRLGEHVKATEALRTDQQPGS